MLLLISQLSISDESNPRRPASRGAEEAKENGGSHTLESDRQKEGCGTILWRDFIELKRQRGYNQQAKGQRNYDCVGHRNI